MTDKIRLIYNKIENRIDEICDDGFVLKENQQEYETLTDLEDFIDTLQEEPKCIYNRTLEERKKFCKYCSAFCTVRIKEEPASEGLEEVAYKYAQQHNELLGFDCNCEPIQTGPEIKKAVIFGAEWQKHKDQETIELAEEHALLAGMIGVKEGLLKHAVEANVSIDYNRNFGYGTIEASIDLDEYKLKEGDKVKIIIIKED